MAHPANIILKLRSMLNSNPKVRGFVLVGSQARKDIYKAELHSDLEAYIIVKDEDVADLEKQLPEIVSQLGRVIFFYKNRWAGFSTVFNDLFRLELPLAKQSELASVFSRPKAQTVRILIDKTDGELEKVLNKRPETINFEKMFKDLVEDFWYMSVVAAQYHKKGEIYNTRAALNVLVSLLIKLMELIQNPQILLLETNKRLEQFLSAQQLNLLKKVTPAYDKEQVKQALKQIINIFPEVLQQVTKKYHYQYRKDLENKIKPKLSKLLGTN